MILAAMYCLSASLHSWHEDSDREAAWHRVHRHQLQGIGKCSSQYFTTGYTPNKLRLYLTSVVTHTSCIAIHTVRSQCQSQWERPNFAPPPSQNPRTNIWMTTIYCQHIHLPHFTSGLQVTFLGQFLRLMAQIMCFCNHWCPLGVSMIYFNI